MLVNRDEVETRYVVLPYMPLPTASEQIKWCTNTFISADLSETRQALAQYPAINITYSFIIKDPRDHRITGDQNRGLSFFNQLEKTLGNEWMLPYYPHMTRGYVLSDGQLAITSVGGHSYPYHEYCCVVNKTRIDYKAISTRTGDGSGVRLVTPFTDPHLWRQQSYVVPCFRAFIDPKFKYQDLGPNRFGGELKLTFRMAGESEKAMTYQFDGFDFIASGVNEDADKTYWSKRAQIPLSVDMNRRQANFAAKPARAHAYTPNAYLKGQTPITRAVYWLDYNDYVRQDYEFRGALMKGLGGETADHYLNTKTLHRLSSDMVTINYDLGVAQAETVLREVKA